MTEREKIVMYLADQPDAHLLDAMPMWRKFIWSCLHPYRFGQVAALSYAALDIYHGKHLDGE